MNKLGSSSYRSGDCGGTYGDHHALATVPQAKQPSLLRRAGQAVKRVGVGALKLGAAAAGAYGAYRLGKHVKGKALNYLASPAGRKTAKAAIGKVASAVGHVENRARSIAGKVKGAVTSAASKLRSNARSLKRGFNKARELASMSPAARKLATANSARTQLKRAQAKANRARDLVRKPISKLPRKPRLVV